MAVDLGTTSKTLCLECITNDFEFTGKVFIRFCRKVKLVYQLLPLIK